MSLFLALTLRLCVLTVLLAGGCYDGSFIAIPHESETYTSELKGALEEPPTFTRLPVTVGVYYSSKFRTYQYRFTVEVALEEYVIPLGKPSARLFDQISPIMFDRVIYLQHRPPLSPAESNLDLIIEPRIEEFDIGYPAYFFQTSRTEIVYRITLYSTDGTPFASWTVTGMSEGRPDLFERSHTHFGKRSDLALQDAAKKFMTGFHNIPEVRAWLRRRGVAGTQ